MNETINTEWVIDSVMSEEFALEITYNNEVSLSFFDFTFDVLYFPVLIPLMGFALIFTIYYIGIKMRHKVCQIMAAFLSLAVSTGFFLYSPPTGSIAILYLALALAMTVTVFIFNFVRLKWSDYFVIFACFVYITRFIRFAGMFGVALPSLCIFMVLLVICKIRLGKLRGNLFYIWFASVFTAVEGYWFNILFSRYILALGQPLKTNIEKLVVWGVATFILIIIVLAIIYGIKRLFHKHFDEIARMGNLYPNTERFFIYNSIIILFLIVILQFFRFIMRHPDSPLFQQILDFFALFTLILQFAFLMLIFRITWLKDNLKNKTLENQSLTIYSSGLEENMDGIQSIKHDIKNIFLTMGHFVEQSGDAEMKDFYREKISPFANEEIMKSDLYGKLMAIGNEQLKAFLFYKISQAVERGIVVDLEVSPYCGRMGVSGSKLEFIDLVRILGILMDNTIEECMELPQGTIAVKISCNDELISYVIKNSINPEKKLEGFKPDVSTKGDGRGKGLKIVRNILEIYDDVKLNSYFQDEYFVQNLVIYKCEVR